MTERRITFSELRNAYSAVRDLLEKSSGVKVTGSQVRLQEDLSLWGDDSYFFLIDFVEKHKLNFEGFDFSKHLYSEDELFDSLSALLALISLPFLIVRWILALIIKIFSRELAEKIFEFNIVPKPFRRREVTDLTMADLITSLTEKKFTQRTEVRYVLIK